MSSRIYTTCRDKALRFSAAGVQVDVVVRANGKRQFWYPIWAGELHRDLRVACGRSGQEWRVLAKAAADETIREALLACCRLGDGRALAALAATLDP